jgi:ATP-dependent Clp protease ATP-binding subunit ClpA
MSLAEQEAKRLRRKSVGTEELLVALADPDSAAYKLLLEFDITVERLRAALIPNVETTNDRSEYLSDYLMFHREKLPFNTNAENALELAADAAAGKKIEVQHIMWGLISIDSEASALLLLLGVDRKKIEREIFESLNLKDAKISEEEDLIDPGKKEPPPRPAGSLKDKYRDKPRKDIDFGQSTISDQEPIFARRPPTVASWFASQAQSAMASAFDESEALGSILGTEHILYGLVCNGTECTTRTFEYTKVTVDSVRQQIRSFKASRPLEENQTLHTSAVTLLEQSRVVMSQCCQELIDCEHLLIAMLHNSDTIAYTILQNLGVDTRVLKEVLLFWMNKQGSVKGSRSVIGRIDYARTKELKSEDPL